MVATGLPGHSMMGMYMYIDTTHCPEGKVQRWNLDLQKGMAYSIIRVPLSQGGTDSYAYNWIMVTDSPGYDVCRVIGNTLISEYALSAPILRCSFSPIL